MLRSALVAVLRRCADRLIRRYGQIVRAHPPPSGPSVKPREMVRAVALVPARVAVSVAVSPTHDCFFPKADRADGLECGLSVDQDRGGPGESRSERRRSYSVGYSPTARRCRL
jgi:hypothetical protein